MGRGLSALMADVGVGPGDAAPNGDLVVQIERVHPNPSQPRRTFDAAALEDLTKSIVQKGILQPLIVRPSRDVPNDYEIVAGERRWRAAQAARLHEIPVVVRDFDDGEVLEVAIIENIQRSDLSALEEASGYRHLMDRFGHTQEQVSEILGKSRSHVANHLRLLSLPDIVRNLPRRRPHHGWSCPGALDVAEFRGPRRTGRFQGPLGSRDGGASKGGQREDYEPSVKTASRERSGHACP